jgi:hypothetical protein
MAKADYIQADKPLKIGDVATFRVVTPVCGLVKGERKKMKVTPELLDCIERGIWKLDK